MCVCKRHAYPVYWAKTPASPPHPVLIFQILATIYQRRLEVLFIHTILFRRAIIVCGVIQSMPPPYVTPHCRLVEHHAVLPGNCFPTNLTPTASLNAIPHVNALLLSPGFIRTKRMAKTTSHNTQPIKPFHANGLDSLELILQARILCSAR